MKLLFYIEPVVFRDDPSFLKPWVDWIARIARANVGLVDVGLCSNRNLCVRFRDSVGAGAATTFPVDLVDVLRPFGFSRTRYGRALYAEESRHWLELTAALEEISEKFSPDVVISFTSAPALRRAFRNCVLLFTEVGPLSRLNGQKTFFFDPGGQHADSILNTRWSEIVDSPCPVTASTAMQLIDRYASMNSSHEAAAPVRDWLTGIARREEISIVALQPTDWPSFEGLAPDEDPISLVLSDASAHPGLRIVPTYHIDQRFDPEMEQFIEAEAPNVSFPPRHLSSGLTELFLPYVHRVCTVSSTTALPAILLGCEVQLRGRSSFWAAAQASNSARVDSTEHAQLVAKLLAFLSNRYLQLQHEVLDTPGALPSYVSCLMNGRDPLDAMLNFADWNLSKAERVLGLSL